MRPGIDFAAFDKSRRYTYREDRFKSAKELGYDSVAEALYNEYTITGSSEIAGGKLEYSSEGALCILRDMGAPIKPRGGDFKRASHKIFQDFKDYGEEAVNAMSIADLAKKFNIAKWTVSVYKKRLGWNKPRTKK